MQRDRDVQRDVLEQELRQRGGERRSCTAALLGCGDWRRGVGGEEKMKKARKGMGRTPADCADEADSQLLSVSAGS